MTKLQRMTPSQTAPQGTFVVWSVETAQPGRSSKFNIIDKGSARGRAPRLTEDWFLHIYAHMYDDGED